MTLVRLFIILLSTILFQNHLLAAKPLRELISKENFWDLVKYDAARIVELQPLWTFQEKVGRKDFFFAGGLLRGLLHREFLLLQSHTPDEIRNMPPPTMKSLQLQAGVDIDIVGPKEYEVQARKTLKHLKNLDYITTGYYAELAEMGGSTLEKTALNPFGVIDPFGGFEDYYNGKLVFHWVDKESFQHLPIVSDNDYSQTAEALRFIRFGHYNLPELALDPESVDRIKGIYAFESEFIMNPERKDWVFVALEKLFHASHENAGGILFLLKRYNMLPLVFGLGFELPEDIKSEGRLFLQKNKNLFSIEEQRKLNNLFETESASQKKQKGLEAFIQSCRKLVANQK